MAKFQMTELLGADVITARLGGGAGAQYLLNDKDVNKAVKLAGDSRYDFCAVGDRIEGFITSVDTATSDGYSTGGVQTEDRKTVVFDGIQADGTGNIAVGDYVVAGTPVALNTALTEAGPRVRKATSQAFAAFAWRVVSILSGTGAAGSVGVIERVDG
jgi:hypothetical protein